MRRRGTGWVQYAVNRGLSIVAGFSGGGGLDPPSVLGLFVMQNSDSGAFLAKKMGNCISVSNMTRGIVKCKLPVIFREWCCLK